MNMLYMDLGKNQVCAWHGLMVILHTTHTC